MSPTGSEEARELAFPGTDFGTVTVAHIDPRLQPVLAGAMVFFVQAARAVALLLSPAAFIAVVLGTWRLGTDLGWTAPFFISRGLFSHWQVWMASAAVLEALATIILRANRKSQPSGQN